MITRISTWPPEAPFLIHIIDLKVHYIHLYYFSNSNALYEVILIACY